MVVQPAAELRFPDFLCIGAQKAGTSWLHDNLRRHPRVWMPWIKELQYFNDVHVPAHRQWTGRHRQGHAEKAIRRLVRSSENKPLDLRTLHRMAALSVEPLSDEWYGRIFAHAREDQICGEVTPEYSLLPPDGIRHVWRLNPSLKIIFLMRDPVDRCWSHLRMLARGRPEFDYLAAATSRDVLARSDYTRILEAWTAVFGADQILTGRIEDIAKDPEPFLRQVVAMIGCEWHPAVAVQAKEAVFVGPDVEMPAAVRAILESRLGISADGTGSAGG